jgi:hypothetical protein
VQVVEASEIGLVEGLTAQRQEVRNNRPKLHFPAHDQHNLLTWKEGKSCGIISPRQMTDTVVVIKETECPVTKHPQHLRHRYVYTQRHPWSIALAFRSSSLSVI